MQPSMLVLVMAQTELPLVEDREGGLVLVVLGLLAVALASVVLAVAYFWVTGRTARARFEQAKPDVPPAPTSSPGVTAFYGNASTQTALFGSAPVEPGPFEETPGRGMLPRPVITNMAPPEPVESEPLFDVPFGSRPPSIGEPIDVGDALDADDRADEPPAPVIQALDGVPMPDRFPDADPQGPPGEPGGRPPQIPNW